MNALIPIVFATDHNFLRPTLVAVHSLLKSSKGSLYDIIILKAKDITESDEDTIITQVKAESPQSSIRFLTPDFDFSSSYLRTNFSEVTYYRLRIPWLLLEYEKVIYADVDIVFNTDLSDLYENFKLGDNYCAGVNKSNYYSGIKYNNIVKLGLDPKEYVNAGFLIINCKKQREDNLFKLFQKYLKPDGYKFFDQDQDIINLVCKGHIAQLPVEYNLAPDVIFKEKIKDYKLIHYTLDGKPWKTITWGWLDWWESYKELIAFDEDFYLNSMRDIYGSAISLRHGVKKLSFLGKIYKIITTKRD